MEFIIRRLQEDDDNERFLELQREFMAQMDKYEPGFSEGMLLDDVSDSDDNYTYFIATLKDKMIAFASLSYEEEYFDNKETFIIREIFVLEKYQKYGIGALLVKNIKEYSQRKNINFLYGSVLPGNVNARIFLKKIGFVEHGEQSFVMQL